MEVNTKTIQFIGFLNELADRSAYGIHPFSEMKEQYTDGLLYDDKNAINANNDCAAYPLIADYLVDEQHHDIVSTWTNVYNKEWLNVVVLIVTNENREDIFVEVTSRIDNEFCIVVGNGKWYSC